MKEQQREVFHVELQSTRPDGYRRGGFGLKRGINRLENVSESALAQLQRDHALLILSATSAAPGPGRDLPAADLSGAGVALSGTEDAGTQPLAAGTELTPVQQLAAHIAAMPAEQFTKGGAPDLKALSALAGRTVTAAERDEALALHQQSAGSTDGE